MKTKIIFLLLLMAATSLRGQINNKYLIKIDKIDSLDMTEGPVKMCVDKNSTKYLLWYFEGILTAKRDFSSFERPSSGTMAGNSGTYDMEFLSNGDLVVLGGFVSIYKPSTGLWRAAAYPPYNSWITDPYGFFPAGFDLEISKNDCIYASFSDGVYRSKNFGASWKTIYKYKDGWGFSNVTSMNNGYLYIIGETMVRSKDEGLTWESYNPPNYGHLVTCDSLTWLSEMSGEVHFSPDYGDTWADQTWNLGLPSNLIPTASFVEKNSNGVLFLTYYIQSYWSLPFEKVTRIFFSGNDGLSFRLFCELEEPKGFKTGIISGDTMHLATFMDNRIYRFDVSKITKEMVTSTNPTMAHSFPSFNLYPSVASTEITVDIGPVINKPATLWIIDNLGRQVLLNEIFGNESRNPVQVNIQSLEPGIYYAILNYNGKNSSRKFIKE